MNEGNKNAEKWTEKTVMAKIKTLQTAINGDMEDVKDCKYLTLGSLLYEYHLYTGIWTYWKDKFRGEKTVFESIKKIDTFFENRLHEGALTGNLNPAVAIFSLKNNYQWTDQKQIDITTKGDRLYQDKTDQQIQDEINRLSKIDTST